MNKTLRKYIVETLKKMNLKKLEREGGVGVHPTEFSKIQSEIEVTERTSSV